jgi:hypothetical protein
VSNFEQTADGVGATFEVTGGSKVLTNRMLQADARANAFGHWRMGRRVCAFADHERHLGHILLCESQWLAFDGTRLGESGIGFRLIGVFPDINSARIAVELATIRTSAGTRGEARALSATAQSGGWTIS